MPRHIRNILIATLLALLALAAGINGYVHHQYKTNIDSTLSAIRPFAQVKYSDLSTSMLSGKVELKNVRISAEVLPETLTLGNITLETPGFIYMINGIDKIKKGELPEKLGLTIDDFYLDLHGETADWLDRLVKRMQPIYESERKLCAGKSIFGPGDYKEMGYTRLLSNMHLAYNFNKANKSLSIKMNAGTSNMGEIETDINITNIGSMSSNAVLQTGMPQLSNIKMSYKDKSYALHIVNYCSKLSKMKKEDFIDAEIKQSDNYFYMIWGFAPGQGLREAYKDFLLKPDLVTLTMTPSKEFNPMLIATMPKSEVVDALNLQLKINGLPINDLSFKMPPTDFTESFERQLESSMNFNALLRGEPIKAPAPAKRKVIKKAAGKYHKITLKQIPKHVGDYVLITTTEGNERKGRLIRLNKGILYVEMRVSGGKFTMSVPRSKIKTIQAFFSK